jgi:hypothetical protein
VRRPGRFVGKYGISNGHALQSRTNAYGTVFYLFEEVSFAANATEPEVFHAPGGTFTCCRCRPGYIEYVDSPLTQVVEWFAALWIRAVVHHWGVPSSETTVARVPRFTYWNVVALRAGRELRARYF